MNSFLRRPLQKTVASKGNYNDFFMLMQLILSTGYYLVRVEANFEKKTLASKVLVKKT